MLKKIYKKTVQGNPDVADVAPNHYLLINVYFRDSRLSRRSHPTYVLPKSSVIYIDFRRGGEIVGTNRECVPSPYAIALIPVLI